MDLAELVKQHQADVWRYLRYLGCDASQADDLTQETFLILIRGSFEERDPTQTACYLRKVARSRYLMALRHQRGRPDVQQLDAAELVWATTLGDRSGNEFLDRLDQCLERLEGRPQKVIRLFYQENHSRDEIARQLNMTTDGVKSLLRRTRTVLRQCVERETNHEP
jgi:RNA polymerase sigma-70 factor (ECF subfamily)